MPQEKAIAKFEERKVKLHFPSLTIADPAQQHNLACLEPSSHKYSFMAFSTVPNAGQQTKIPPKIMKPMIDRRLGSFFRERNFFTTVPLARNQSSSHLVSVATVDKRELNIPRTRPSRFIITVSGTGPATGCPLFGSHYLWIRSRHVVGTVG